MYLRFSAALILTCIMFSCAAVSVAADDGTTGKSNNSVNILLITSGCCHDYDFQTKAMQLAMEKQGVEAVWTVVNDGGTGTKAEIGYYNDPKWADGFDVVIHNECFANTSSPDYIRRITGPHRAGANAVVIHCAMHTYRAAEVDDWRKFLGVTSRRHEHQSNYRVDVKKKNHPIMVGFPDGHITAKDELYVIEKVWPDTTVLATSESEKTGKDHPVFWVNQFGKARVFGTTYGHSNGTFQDDVFLRTLTRGTLWAAGVLSDSVSAK